MDATLNGNSRAADDDTMIQMMSVEEQLAEQVHQQFVVNPDEIVPPDNTRNPLFAAFAKLKEKGKS